MTAQELENAKLRHVLKDVTMERDIRKKGDSHLLRDRSKKRSFITAYRHLFPIENMCKLPGMSASSYYDGITRPVSARSRANAEIAAFISARNPGPAQRYCGSPRWTA
jgi:hypothetical protein